MALSLRLNVFLRAYILDLELWLEDMKDMLVRFLKLALTGISIYRKNAVYIEGSRQTLLCCLCIFQSVMASEASHKRCDEGFLY